MSFDVPAVYGRGIAPALEPFVVATERTVAVDVSGRAVQDGDNLLITVGQIAHDRAECDGETEDTSGMASGKPPVSLSK